MRLIRFGTGSAMYYFPAQTELSDNFGDLVQRATRLPGVSGGYRAYGDSPSPSEVGTLRTSFWLIPNNISELQGMVDAVNALKRRGVSRLYAQQRNSSSERWCFAEVSSIQISENVRDMPHLRQRVGMTFQVTDPFWYEINNESWVWGDGTTWGSSSWGGVAAQPLTTLSNDFTETVGGNAITYPRILLSTGVGVTCTNPTIQRLVGGNVVDQVSYTGTIAQNSTLQINTRALAVVLNGANAYTSAFSWLLPSWFRLEPGANSIRVTFSAKTGDPTLKMQYYTRW